MLTTGERTWRMPRLAVSAATAEATSATRSASHVAARPIAWGNDVAPGWTSPWRASSKGTTGIPEPGLFDEELLDGVDPHGRVTGAIGGNLKAEDPVREALRAAVEVAGGHEQLAEFLFGRHAGEEVVDASVDRQAGIAIGERAGTGGRAPGRMRPARRRPRRRTGPVGSERTAWRDSSVNPRA